MAFDIHQKIVNQDGEPIEKPAPSFSIFQGGSAAKSRNGTRRKMTRDSRKKNRRKK